MVLGARASGRWSGPEDGALMRKTRVAESPLALSSTQGPSEDTGIIGPGRRSSPTPRSWDSQPSQLLETNFCCLRHFNYSTLSYRLRHPRIPQWTLCPWQPEHLPTAQRRMRMALCNSGSPFWLFLLWTWIYPSSHRAHVTSFIYPYLILQGNLHKYSSDTL